MMHKGAGQPPFEPTEQQRQLVEQMTAVGIPQESIARVIKIDSKTLRKHFRDELDTAAAKANTKVGGMLFNKAINGDTSAAIWWSKSRMGWKETSVNQHTDGEGNPLAFQVTLVAADKDT